jgi:hypothetical protein
VDQVVVTPGRHEKICVRQRQLLVSLALYDGWARPMDVGGRDGSHHTTTLRSLVKKSLVERRVRNSLLNMVRGHEEGYENLAKARRGRKWPGAPRGSYEYRITDAGRVVVGR